MTSSNFNRLCIAICTRERPKLLLRLLKSLSVINAPDNVGITVLVVENDATPTLQKTLTELNFPFEIEYAYEKKIGLAHARNHALDEAERMNFEWVAFLDDDEEVHTDWLKSYIEAITLFPDTKIFFGSVCYRYPEDYTPYLRRIKSSKRKLGQPPQVFDTGNVLFHNSVLQSVSSPHRFHHAFNVSGGEDTEFFVRMKKLGHKICYVPNSKVSEDKSGKRALLSTNLERYRRNQTNYSRIIRLNNNWLYSVLANILIANRQIFYGFTAFIFGTVIYPFTPKHAKYYWGDGMIRMYRLLGVIDHAKGITSSFYKTIDQYENEAP